MTSQLPLGLHLREAARFENFVPGDNLELVDSLRAAAVTGGLNLYLWGPGGCGKTHLLQAACWAAHAGDRRPIYLSLADPAISSVRAMEGLERAALVCLDDLDFRAGDRDWEEAIFAAFNRVREAGATLCVAAAAAAGQLGLTLPDLESRMNWDLVYALKPLDDEGREAALTMRAGERGLDLPPETARYLLSRQQRDLPSLFRLLDRLDRASLAAQRRLTIPFVREVLARHGDKR